MQHARLPYGVYARTSARSREDLYRTREALIAAAIARQERRVAYGGGKRVAPTVERET